MRFIVVFLLFIGLLSCESGSTTNDGSSAEAEEVVDLKKALPGTWESVSLKVTINSLQNSDSSYVFQVEEENWERKLGVRPVKYFYTPDQKFRRVHYDARDSITEVTRGIWNVFGDTLMMIAEDATYQYEVSLKNGLSEYRTYLDWDGDGEEDDEYIGVQRLIGIGTE